jgi:rod shape-determining protein MreD
MNTETRLVGRTFTLAGSLIAFLLQLIIAPNIAVLDAVPNLILGFIIINAMYSNNIRSTLTGFILGLLYDLIAQGPLGIMSFVGALVGYGVSSLNKELFSGGWPVQALAFLAAAFAGELLHAASLSILGYDPNFLLSLGMRVVPGALYIGVLGLAAFLIVHFIRERGRQDPGVLKGKFD